MAQTVQILRTTTNNPPPTLLPGALSVELGTQTKLWVGSAGGNRLLMSSDPADIALSSGCVVAATPPANPIPGLLWWDSTGGQLYVRYQDPNSTAWVAAASATGSFLPISGGTLTGPLILSGPPTDPLGAATKAYADGKLALTGGTLTGALTLNTNGATLPAAPANTTIQMAAPNGTTSRLVIDGYGTGAGGAITFRTGRGTPTGMTPVQAGDSLGALTALAVAANGTTFSTTPKLILNFAASQNWSGSGTGARYVFAATADGTTSSVNVLYLGATDPGQLTDAASIIPKRWRMAVTAGDEASAGSIDYRISDAGALTITGAGTAVSSRNVRINDTLFVNGAVSAYNYWVVNRAAVDAGQVGFGNTNGPTLLFGGNNYANGGAVELTTQSQLAIKDLAGAGKFAFLISNGQAYKPGGGTWTDISDIRTKEPDSIAPYDTGLAAVLQLNPITYRKNGRGGTAVDGRTYVGLVADHVVGVMPEMVGTKLEKLDEGDPEPTEILTLEATALTYALVNAIKEIEARLTAGGL